MSDSQNNSLTLSQNLESQEAIVEAGLKTFYEVGEALGKIRDERLYKANASYKSFDQYLKDRWGMTKTHANRLIEAGKVTQEVTPMGVTLPTSERQARPLTKLPEGSRAEVWEEVVEDAEESGEPITAKKVEAKVAEKLADREPQSRPTTTDHAATAEEDREQEEAREESQGNPWDEAAADLGDVAKSIRAAAKELRRITKHENGESTADWLCHVPPGWPHQLRGLAKTIEDAVPVGGEPRKPISVQDKRQQDAADKVGRQQRGEA